MRSFFSYTLLFTIVFAGAYVLYGAYTTCQVPMTYRLGTVDARFDLSEEQALTAIDDAVTVWESAVGGDLFTYDPAGDLTINFIYDDRQAFADAAASSLAQLNEAQRANATLSAQYDALIASYNTLQASYKTDATAYEDRLEAYNTTVAQYNDAGGAPPAEYTRLQREADALAADRSALRDTESRLRDIVTQINDLSEQGNQVIAEYNEEVQSYNQTFGDTREFTQGTYHSGGHIDIYTFDDPYELRLVLAHELGHALGIGHVVGSQSIMYYLIGGQPDPLMLSPADTSAFNAICGPGSLWNNIQAKTESLFAWF